MLASLGLIKDLATRDALQEVQLASADENLVDLMQSYTITGTFTETRTLNVGTSSLAETQAFIATLINDLKRGGEHRTT